MSLFCIFYSKWDRVLQHRRNHSRCETCPPNINLQNQSEPKWKLTLTSRSDWKNDNHNLTAGQHGVEMEGSSNAAWNASRDWPALWCAAIFNWLQPGRRRRSVHWKPSQWTRKCESRVLPKGATSAFWCEGSEFPTFSIMNHKLNQFIKKSISGTQISSQTFVD